MLEFVQSDALIGCWSVPLVNIESTAVENTETVSVLEDILGFNIMLEPSPWKK